MEVLKNVAQPVMDVRHRVDDLEANAVFRYFYKNVRHRVDDLEVPVFSLITRYNVRHRVDDLEVSC
ncbi:hypothetical protein ACINWC323_0754 [Acinetobacter sp. WC-323]|nr:hypothetical protein ACINWC323_0754 [Acinetobacter sp. WC-323]